MQLKSWRNWVSTQKQNYILTGLNYHFFKNHTDGTRTDSSLFSHKYFHSLVPELNFKCWGRGVSYYLANYHNTSKLRGNHLRNMFTGDILKKVTSLDWWKSLKHLALEAGKVVVSFLKAAASSGVERISFSCGLINSELRIHLGPNKAAKVVFLFKIMKKQEEEDRVSYSGWDFKLFTRGLGRESVWGLF